MVKKIHLRIIIPKGKFYEDDIDYIVLKSTTGDIAIMPGHTPIVSLLSRGLGKIIKDKKSHMISIMGGILEVSDDNTITILTPAAEWPEEIDIERAKYSKSRADRRLNNIDEEGIDKKRAEEAMERAEVRIKLSLLKKK